MIPGRRRDAGRRLEELDDEELDYLAAQEARTRELAEQVYDSEDDFELVDSEDEESDDEGGSLAKKRRTQRDGERIAAAKLRHQGILAEDADGGEEAGGWDPDEEIGLDPKAEKLSRRHIFEHVFGKQADEQEMEKFSMRDYRSTQDGYLRDVTEKDFVQDAWLQSIDEAKDGELDVPPRKIPRGDEAVDPSAPDYQKLTPLEAIGRIIGLLQPEETVFDRVRKLGAPPGKPGSGGGGKQQRKPRGFRKNVRKKQQQQSSAAAAGGGDGVESEEKEKKESKTEREARIQKLGLLTDMSSFLLRMGHNNIHDQTREQLQRTYAALQEQRRRELRALAAAQAARQTPMWEYKWTPDDEEVHGPFPGEKMNEWREHFDQSVVRRILPPAEDGSLVVQAWRPASDVRDFRRVPLDDNDAEEEEEAGAVAAVASAQEMSNDVVPGRKRGFDSITQSKAEDEDFDIFAAEPTPKKRKDR